MIHLADHPADQLWQAASLTGRRWSFAEVPDRKARQMSRVTGLHPLAARYLLQQGLTTPEAVREFLATDATALPPPDAMRHYPEAIRALREALDRGDHIRIVGDYDCDGTLGLITLRESLLALAGDHRNRISWYIPDRDREGYGLNRGIVERAAADGVKVLVSIDIGITAHAEWQLVRDLGMTGICIDHHTALGSRVPEAALVLCPKQAGDAYPEKHLAACGLAWQVAAGVLDGCPAREALLTGLLPLVAIGTYADLVTLRSPANRFLVRRGLEVLNRGRDGHPPGLRALLASAGLDGQSVTDTDLGFRLAPRINAAGRIAGTTGGVVELLTTDDPETARRWAAQLETWNETRQDLQSRLLAHLTSRLAALPAEQRLLVMVGDEADGWHPGILGIVASRLVELTGRPVLLGSQRDGRVRGSGRSVPGFDLIAALQAVASDDLFYRYGGHPAAVGFSLPAAHVGELITRLEAEAARQWPAGVPQMSLTILEELPLAALTPELVRELRCLGPHGMDWPAPRFLVRGRIRETRIVQKRHLQLVLEQDNVQLQAWWWDQAPLGDTLRPGADLVAVGTPEWQRREAWGSLQFIIADARCRPVCFPPPALDW